MTRTRAAALTGVEPQNADVDTPVFASVLSRINQELNRVYDVVTGENGISAAQTMTHEGGATGAPLRRVIAAQVMPVSTSYTGSGRILVASADVADYGGDTYVILVPLLVTRGQTSIDLLMSLDIDDAKRIDVDVYDATGVLVQSTPASAYGQPPTTVTARLVLLSPGRYFFGVRWRVTDDTGARLLSWCLAPPERADGYIGGGVRGLGSPFPVGNGAAPSALYETIHDEMLTPQSAIAGWLVTALSRNASWLTEYLTGAAVPGNAATRQADSGPVNPVTSRFAAHTRAGFAAEPEVQLPVLTASLGLVGYGVIVGSLCAPISANGFRGVVDWGPIVALAPSTAFATAWSTTCYLPDFPTSPSKLKAQFLFCNDNGKGTPTLWSARVTTSAGTSTTVAFSRVGTTRMYTAECVAIPFIADARNAISFEVSRSVVGTVHGECMLVGVSLFFDP